MKRTGVIGTVLVLACCDKGEAKRAEDTSAAAEKTTAEVQPLDAEITALVLEDLGSNAFGNLELPPSCVIVEEEATASDGSTVVAARVKTNPECSKSEYLWIYSRAKGAEEWSHDFLGTGPECWKGVPENRAAAVAKTSGIPTCE